ncbi:MAG: hypothetical protein HQM08_26730 [Candidatus Riflebacteria bacterium]|nr:hypothetical protein [Candidatus Riflebacteria bacterium]
MSDQLAEITNSYKAALINEINYGHNRISQRLSAGESPENVVLSMMWTKKWIDALKRFEAPKLSDCASAEEESLKKQLKNEIA